MDKLKEKISRAFFPAEIDQIEIQRTRSFLRGILIFALIATGIGTVAQLFTGSDPRAIGNTLIFNGLLLFAEIGMYILTRKNRWRTASFLLIVIFWFYTSAAMFYSGGLGNPVSGILLVLILIAGTLLDTFGIILALSLTIVSSASLAMLELSGKLPAPILNVNPAQAWIVYFTITMAGSVVMYLWYTSFRRALKLTREEIKKRETAQAELRESEIRYRQAIVAANAVPYSLDYRTNRYTFLGESIAPITGYAPHELTPELFSAMLQETTMLGSLEGLSNEEATNLTRNGGRNDEIWRCDFRIINRWGENRWLSDAAVQVVDINGKAIGSIGILQDITDRKRVEQELRESEERYRMISSVISDYSFVSSVDENGIVHVEWVAGAFETISGYTFEEYKTSGGWRAHIHPDDLGQDDRDFQKLKNNQRIMTEIRVVRKDDSICWVRVYAHPIWSESENRLTGIYGAVQDITQQKEAEAREASRSHMLEKVIELGKTVTQTTNLDECMQAIHRSVQKGLGFDRVGLFLYDAEKRTVQGAYGTSREGEMEDTSWFVQSIDEYEAWQVALKTPSGLNVVDDYQEQHHHNAQSEMYGVKQHITLAAWAGEKPVGLIAVDNVISNRNISPVEVEALHLFAGYAGLAIENSRLNDQLEERVRNRTSELEDSIKELESFSYTVSHDLRAPLRAIHGYTRILELDFAERIPAEASLYLKKIQVNAKTMGQLVDDLLAFSRLSRQHIRKDIVNVHNIFEMAIESLKDEETSPNLEIKLNDLPPCRADAALLKQAAINLLSNAIKYTRTRPNARIEIGAIPHVGKTAYYVRDNGIGFDMKYVDKLFGVFQRLHAGTEFEGTGVGLAIVHRIIQRHGGIIWADAEVDKGATFYFTME